VLLALADRDPRVRRAAVEALRPAPSLRAVKALARTVGAWSDPELDEARGAAVDFLVELGDELYAVEYAQALVEDEQRSSLGEAETSAVRRLFDADSGPVAEIFANQLARRIGVAGEPERELVLQTMVAMGDVAVAPLLSALSDPARQRLAVRALGQLRDPRAVEPLIGLLSAGDAALRADVARALGSIRHPCGLDGLVRASGDSDAAVRDAAIEALDHMRGAVLGLLVAGGRPDPELEHLPPADGGARTRPQGAADRVADNRPLLHRLLGGDADARRAARIALRGGRRGRPAQTTGEPDADRLPGDAPEGDDDAGGPPGTNRLER
jgi:hypothetical protein